MSDTIQERLRMLADWFDVYDDKRGFDGDREVQRDLRNDADEIDRLRAELADANRKLEIVESETAKLWEMARILNATAIRQRIQQLRSTILGTGGER